MPAANEAMQVLTSQWYNAIATQLKLSPQQFQMVQGNIALGSVSSSMWALMDSIPPESITQYWTPQAYKSFSSQYGLVITRIHDPSTSTFETTMGEYYPGWAAYLEKTTIPENTSLITVFKNWAFTHMPVDKAQTCLSLLAAALNGPVGEAGAAWNEVGGSRGIKAYNQSISTVEHTISAAPSASVVLDSATESSDTTNTWAKGETGGFFDIFFGKAGASYSKSTVLVTEAGLQISVQFEHMATIPIVPLSQGTIVSGPTTYKAWYVPAAISLAYQNNNYQVWQSGTPNWASFFGEHGSLPRAATALLLVDGISVSVTSHKSIAAGSREEVEASFEAGFFPFFGIEGEGGWSTSHKFNDAGQITATAKCSVGNPQALGVLQSPIAQMLASEALREAQRSSRASVAPAVQSFEATAEVAEPEADVLVGVVYVAWSARAQIGLMEKIPNPAIQKLAIGFVNTWALNSAPGWAVGAPHEYHGGPPAYVATAQVVRAGGGDREVEISEFA